MKQIFLGKTTEKGISFGSDFNKRRFLDFCKKKPGVLLRIEEFEKKRSKSQNSLYWMYLNLIEMETGNSSIDLHEFFKKRFLPPKVITIKEHEEEIQRSTTELSRKEFSEYIDKIELLTGVLVPDTQYYEYLRDLAPLIEE